MVRFTSSFVARVPAAPGKKAGTAWNGPLLHLDVPVRARDIDLGPTEAMGPAARFLHWQPAAGNPTFHISMRTRRVRADVPRLGHFRQEPTPCRLKVGAR
jgi:hypothetical protein